MFVSTYIKALKNIFSSAFFLINNPTEWIRAFFSFQVPFMCKGISLMNSQGIPLLVCIGVAVSHDLLTTLALFFSGWMCHSVKVGLLLTGICSSFNLMVSLFYRGSDPSFQNLRFGNRKLVEYIEKRQQ